MLTGSSTKDEWRTVLLAARRRVTTHERAARDAALATHAAALVAPLVTGRAAVTVCAYVPVGCEPGSTALLDALVGAGAAVLLPVVDGPTRLDWAGYTGAGQLAAGPFGLREPGGPRRGVRAIGGARVVLVPALAVARDGVRLGRGGGFYDRALPLTDPAAQVVAVVDDDELVPALPTDHHDVRVGWALTPRRGLTRRAGAGGGLRAGGG